MRTLIIIASGPSLTRADVARAEASGFPIMGINCAFQICFCLDYLYACDVDFWQQHHTRVKHLPCRKFRLRSDNTSFPIWPDVECMQTAGTHGLSLEWPKLKTGSNSGYQAINLAVLLGYNRLILLGYDMQMSAGKAHWHEDHPGNNPTPQTLERWKNNFEKLAPLLIDNGVSVINATRQTALTCFKQMALEDVL